MTYDEKLAEFVRATGSKPGEMNKRLSGFPATQAEVDLYLPRRPGESPKYGCCNASVTVQYDRAHVVKPCALPAGHEGEHSA